MGLAAVIGLLVVGWVVFTFNRLTRLRQLGDNAWADIDVQLKRRHDLIPNVVAVVQGHAGYERGTLEALVAARGRALQASDRGPATRAREEDPLASALQRVVAVAEAYPELKAAASFAGLQTTLTDVEDHLQNARRYYNAVVRDFNTAIAQFPSGIIAGMMRVRPREFFGLDDPSERAVPKVPLVLLLMTLAATGSLAGQRSYAVERFDAQIRVNRDASLDVTETITARFVGSYNGLYRTIPIKYRNAQGLNWTLGVSLQSARDDGGRNLRTETTRQGAYLKYKVGIPGGSRSQCSTNRRRVCHRRKQARCSTTAPTCGTSPPRSSISPSADTCASRSIRTRSCSACSEAARRTRCTASRRSTDLRPMSGRSSTASFRTATTCRWTSSRMSST